MDFQEIQSKNRGHIVNNTLDPRICTNEIPRVWWVDKNHRVEEFTVNLMAIGLSIAIVKRESRWDGGDAACLLKDSWFRSLSLTSPYDIKMYYLKFSLALVVT